MDTNPPDKPLGGDNSDSDLLNEGASLEYGDTNAQSSFSNPAANTTNATSPANPQETDKKPPKDNALRRLWSHFNIYLLLFMFVLVIAGAAGVVFYFKNRAGTTTSPGTVNQQNLPASTLQELASNGVQVGDPKQVLNIQSNSVFNGAVLVKGELQIAGGLKIGSGSLAIPEINVGGNATVNQLQTQTLGVSGSARANDLSVLNNLSVNGNGTFNGALTTPSLSVGRLQLNGDLTINRHLVAGGATPGRSNGNALGGGGTTTVSGSDTAGSVTVNTGSGPAAGCFVTVNFTNGFSATPHVVITPVGSAAADLSYYINRSTSNFSVCTASPAPGNTSFGFDYHVFD